MIDVVIFFAPLHSRFSFFSFNSTYYRNRIGKGTNLIVHFSFQESRLY